MNTLALPRGWQLVLGALVVLYAIVSQPGREPVMEAPSITIPEAVALIEAGALVIDVRDSPKTHLPNALLIPLETLAAHLPKLEAAKAKSIVVYCGNGTTLGPRAVHVLKQAGFAHAVNLAPGIEGWRAANLPVVSS